MKPNITSLCDANFKESVIHYMTGVSFFPSNWQRRQTSELPLVIGDRCCLSFFQFFFSHRLLDINCSAFDTIVSALRAVIQSLGIHGHPQLYNFVPPCKFLTGEYYTIILLHQVKEEGSPVS